MELLFQYIKYKDSVIIHKSQFYIFALMKFYFKIILIALISCCYVNTVFEFSDNEEKVNFEKESHCYIQQDTQTLNSTYSKIVLQLDNVIENRQTKTVNPVIVCVNDSNYKTDYFLPSPERRYILYSSLII